MKPFLPILITCASLGAISASADVAIVWSSPANSIKQSDGTTNAPQTWMAQLIFSPTGTPSAIDPLNPFVPTGVGEVVMAANQLSPVVPITGRITVGDVDGPDSMNGGFVYTRVFNVDYNGGSPSTPTLYGNSPVSSGPLVGPVGIDPTNVIQHWAAATANSPLVVNQRIVAIPEPSTYALAFIGIVAALWRRRKA